MLAAKLDAELLERFYARLHQCREMCTGRPRAGHTCQPLSTSTTRKIHYIIRGALERAVRWRHLGVNKASLATIASIMPKPVPVPSVRGPYETIAEDIREDIRSGRLKPGDQLPTVAELAVANTVAVGTAHRAMTLLKLDGLIEVSRGRRATVTR